MKRRAITIMAYLLLGAIINVAVALWLAIRPAASTGIGAKPPYTFWALATRTHTQVEVQRLAGELRVEERFRTPERRGELRRISGQLLCGWDRVRPLIPAHSRFNGPSPLMLDQHLWSERGDPRLVEHFTGWPAYSMVYRFLEAQDYERASVMLLSCDGMADLSLKWLPENWRRRIGWKPAYSGFAANTVFYASGLWLLAMMPRTLRIHLRKRRGQCTACAYNLRGNPEAGVCPECGTVVGSRAPSSCTRSRSA